MSKKFLVTFADTRFAHVFNRFRAQADSMNVYDEILTYTEFELDEEFREKFQHRMRPKLTRGFGYWCWKPQVILQALEQMEDGDLLQYTDAGCHLNPNGRDRLIDYFNLVENDEAGILVFQAIRPDKKLDDGRSLPKWTESMWCKGDVLDYFDVRDDKEIIDSPVIGAGISFFKKNNLTVDFVKEWLCIIEENFSLIDDSPSVSKNTDNFIDHRHDQSLFSILCKLHGITNVVSAFEYSYPANYISDDKKFFADWEALKDYPILAMRDIKKIRTR